MNKKKTSSLHRSRLSHRKRGDIYFEIRKIGPMALVGKRLERMIRPPRSSLIGLPLTINVLEFKYIYIIYIDSFYLYIYTKNIRSQRIRKHKNLARRRIVQYNGLHLTSFYSRFIFSYFSFTIVRFASFCPPFVPTPFFSLPHSLP